MAQAISKCFGLVLAMGLAAAPGWAQQSQEAQFPTSGQSSPTPATPTTSTEPAAAYPLPTVPEVLVAAGIIVFGISIFWVLAMIMLTSMVRRRDDPAEAYWQSVGFLLFGTWITVFLGVSGLASQGLWAVNWWIWGFYLAVGLVVALFVARLGRQSRAIARTQS